MLKKTILLIGLLLSTASVSAEVPDWLDKAIKVSNPNQLAYFVDANGCPLKKEELQDIVEGLLIRSRIKPLKEDIFVKDRVYLSLGLTCTKGNGGHSFAITSQFGRYYPSPAVLLFDYDFGSMGAGSKTFIEQVFKSKVENAVTAFVKSNFNL